jgi:serine protease Do
MNARRITTTIFGTVVVGALLVLSGALEFQIRWLGNDAEAIDFFGNESDTSDSSEAETFWNESQGLEPIVPVGVPGSFADLAERASPGVVNIATSKTVVQNMPRSFEEFYFGTPFGSGPHHGGTPRKIPSLGSGFVISPDGYIVTNNHVIEDVDAITVIFDNGAELPAQVVGRDPKTDVALIQVETDEELFALPLGNSSSVRPGEWVVAIGNPFGLEHTVTAGIISAKHRVIGQGNYDDYIQTDAAINPGNSGGPLLNLSGEVIGINTAINPQANTIGFAVPIDLAKTVLPQLRASGHVTRGWLGVMIQHITPELAEALELDDEKGALVSKVIPGGPASESGIERSDVIVEFDGKKIESMSELPRAVAETPVDKRVKVVVIRDGKRKTLRAEVGLMEEPDATELASAPQGGGPAAFGMRVQDLTPELAERLGVDESQGAVVTSVEPGSPADDAHLRRGDVILEVDRTEVNDVGDLRDRLEAADDGALLLVRRGDATIFVPIKRGAS